MNSACWVSCRFPVVCAAIVVLTAAWAAGQNASSGIQSSSPATTVVDFPVPKLLKAVPELHGLKPAHDQQQLSTLLENVGNRVYALFHKMPNLISHEQVLQSRNGSKATRQEFEYLILSHPTEKDVTLDEYRIDLHDKTLQSDDVLNPAAILSGGAAALADLERRSLEASSRNKGGLALSQGFANSWTHFYPANRPQASFRYLGVQILDGRQTAVIAFAQTPAAVPSPAELHFEGQSFPIYYQGIAWVEESDFRILKLRTDLLSPVNAVHLQRLTAEVYFGKSRIAQNDVLWLPQRVKVTVAVNGDVFEEQHFYSGYRAYGAETKITY